MKIIKIFLMTLLLGLLVSMNTSIKAQDPVKVASNVYKKVILDNEKVRVIEVEFAPGESTAWHQHPNHVIYALSDGQLEITEKGKAANVIDIKAGTAMYLPAVTHMAKNTGNTTVKLVVTEIKSSAPKK